MCRDKKKVSAWFITGVIDIGDELMTGINDNGDKPLDSNGSENVRKKVNPMNTDRDEELVNVLFLLMNASFFNLIA